MDSVNVNVTPTVEDIASLIWSMDSEEQTKLLCELDKIRENSKGRFYMQAYNIAQEVKAQNVCEKVSNVVSVLNEYLGYSVLKEGA